MKKIHLISFLILSIVANAQIESFGNITIKADSPFFVFLDGTKMNEIASADVTLLHLEKLKYPASFVFENEPKQTLSDSISTTYNGIFSDITYRIVKDSTWRLILQRAVPLVVVKDDKQVFRTTDALSLNVGNPRDVFTDDNGCSIGKVMKSDAFNSMIMEISAEPTDDLKLNTARQITRKNCLSTNQILQVSKLLAADHYILDYLKFAFSACVNQKNYETLFSQLKSKESKSELNYFISGK